MCGHCGTAGGQQQNAKSLCSLCVDDLGDAKLTWVSPTAHHGHDECVCSVRANLNRLAFPLPSKRPYDALGLVCLGSQNLEYIRGSQISVVASVDFGADPGHDLDRIFDVVAVVERQHPGSARSP